MPGGPASLMNGKKKNELRLATANFPKPQSLQLQNPQTLLLHFNNLYPSLP